MSSKGATGGPWGHKLKLTFDILELPIQRKQIVGGRGGGKPFWNFAGHLKKCLGKLCLNF